MNPYALVLAVMLAVWGCCGAVIAASPPGIDDTSTVSSDGTRTLRQSVIVSAPLAAAWNAFTTTEGYRAWAAPVAQVDFRLGGFIETSYAPDGRIGAPGNIRNQIVAYAPERMFAIVNHQAPPDVPFDTPTFQSLHTVVQSDDVGGGATRVTIIQPGYRAGDAYDRTWKFFEWGNGATLVALRDRFVKGPTDWRSPAP